MIECLSRRAIACGTLLRFNGTEDPPPRCACWALTAKRVHLRASSCSPKENDHGRKPVFVHFVHLSCHLGWRTIGQAPPRGMHPQRGRDRPVGPVRGTGGRGLPRGGDVVSGVPPMGQRSFSYTAGPTTFTALSMSRRLWPRRAIG